MSNNNPQIRLTKYFIPYHYEINLDLDIINLTYVSKVEIFITSQIDNPKYFSLNSKSYSKESKIINYELINVNRKENYIIEKLDSCPENYTNTISSIYFSLKNGIKKGQNLIFKCEKKEEIKTSIEGYGLYISFWDYKLRKLLDKKEFNKNNYTKLFKDKNNPTIEEIKNNFNYFKSLVISLNSSPIGLREVIPCFDDPCFKATYKFTISVHKNFINSSKNFTIVNNADIDKILEKNNKKIYIFKKIPKISCYLLTFTIGYYEYIEKYINKVNNDKLRLRVYAPENQMNKVDFSLSLTEDALKKYEKLFNFPYYLDKLDSIFIPNLNFTAMEFLGCITYKQELMLDKNNTSSILYRMIIKIVYHEVFHNWIGNLATMEFFDNTWLNEGITKFIDNYISLHLGKGYFNDIMRLSYFYTLTWKNHSLCNKSINNEELIHNCFDNITYEKGGYIINMLLSYFGKVKIFKGLRLYFEKYKFGNANEKDFLNIMSEVFNFDVKDLLNEWIYKKSFPILYTTFSEDKNEIIIEQEPNFDDQNVIFKIPIFIKTKNLEKIVFMKERTINFKLIDFNITYEDINNKGNFIIFNSDIKCFFVVNYDEILKNSIFYFYNKYNSSNNINENNNEKRVSDADIYQILISNMYSYSNDYLVNDIQKLKNIKNNEIIYYIFYQYGAIREQTSKFFKEDINNSIIRNKEYFSKLIYEIIDYNNTELINKIIEKFDKPNNSLEEDISGEIDFEKIFIFIICLFKREEKIVKKLYDSYKKSNYNLYKINKTYRTFFPIILNEFMYLFPEKEKLIIYKSIAQYYEEMFYNLYFLEKENFEEALNYLNNGLSYEILDYYFDNFDINDNCKVDDIIVDYFFKYINQLFSNNIIFKSFQDYLYDICVNKEFEINDNKFQKIHECYLIFVNKSSIDKEKLLIYCDEKYLHLKEIKDNKKIKTLKNKLNLK